MSESSPRDLIQRLLADARDLPFPAEAVTSARRWATSPASAPAAEVLQLPEPLAEAVVEAAVQARSAALPQALSRIANRALAKSAKRAIYRLKSAGVEIPNEERPSGQTPPPAPAQPAEELPGVLSGITGEGERALICPHPLPGGGVGLYQFVLSDEYGVVALEEGDTSRGGWRKQLKALRAGQAGRPVLEIGLPEARGRLGRAVGRNLATGRPFPPGLERAMRHLNVAPDESLEALPAPASEDLALSRSGQKLHQTPEIGAWLPPEAQIRAFADTLDAVENSVLELNAAQKAEQLRDGVARAWRALFRGDTARLYGLRLWDMADFFERTGRSDLGAIARAEARRIFHEVHEPFSPFAEFFFTKVLSLSQAHAAGQLPYPGASRGEPGQPARCSGSDRTSPGGIILP